VFTEGARHVTWTSRRERDHEGGDSEVRNKLSTCDVAVRGGVKLPDETESRGSDLDTS